MDYERARRAISRELARRGWNPADLARAADKDEGTVLDFLNGLRKPQLATRGRIEAALGWPAGTIDDIAAGGDAPLPVKEEQEKPILSVVPSILDQPEEDNEVLMAVRRDPHLDETAKEHYLNQYELLVLASAQRRFLTERGQPDLLPYVAHGKRTTPVDPDEEAAIEERTRSDVRQNPESPHRDK